MAERPPNGAQPKPRPENAAGRRERANAQNARRDESLASVQWNILNPEKKKRSKKNKKKKTAEVAAADGAGRSGSVSGSVPQVSHQAKSTEDAPPQTLLMDPQQKYMLEWNYIVLLTKKSVKNPKAVFLCELCKYHCDNMTVVENHVSDHRHLKAMEEEAERITMINLPSPTPEQLKYLDELLKEEVKQHGLSDDDILARQNIATILGKSIAETMPGFTVRLYGSSASGFGLKNSDVNLELCVPPEKSPPRGLAAAHDVIVGHNAYSKIERDFTAEIPAVRFVDNSTNLACSLTLSNNHSYKIAELFFKYASINEHVRTLGIAFRLWAKYCKLDNAEAGMWPPYAFPFLLVYFLQQLREPVLPVLHELVDTTDVENKSDVYLDPKNLEGIWKSENAMSLGELWLELFRFYALDFDIFGRVVCIQQSSPLLRNDGVKRWLGKKIAIRDPFMRKRNVTRSMSAHVSFEYCMTCFRNTYKYFGILQTETGPIFGKISYVSKELLSQCKQMAATNNIARDRNDTQPYFSKGEATIMTVSEVEENLRKATLPACNLASVSVQQAREKFSLFNSTFLHYEFTAKNFVGKQNYPEICSSCQKDGHSKNQCMEDHLADFDTTLPPMEEQQKEALDKLCAQMLAKWAITLEEVDERKKIIADLQEYIVQYYQTAKLELFGSTCNGFGLLKSDIDICLTFTDSETGKEHDFVKVIEDLQEKLKKFGVLNNLVPITTAKVPILKFYHVRSELEGDISIYNTLGQQNTRLLRTYAEIDPRVKMLGYMLKRFAKVCYMCDASRGSLSSYAYIIMLIYFLQQCSPPVLPVLQELSETDPKPQRIVEDYDTYFYEDLDNLEKLWPDRGKNTSSVGELWIELLRFYSADFDFGTNVISIKQKEHLSCFDKMWTSKCMAIEDPFDLSHNLGAGLSRKMHVYIIMSFRKGYLHFGIPPPDLGLMTSNPEEYYFKSEKLTSGDPPNDRGCRICKKIGHLCKDCPQKKQGRNKRPGQRGDGTGGGGSGRKGPETSTVQHIGYRNFNPANNPLRGYNPPFGLPHSPMRGAQSGRGKFRNSGELPPYRESYNPVHGNFRSQVKSGMRYGMPRASPPFKPCASPMDMSRRNGAMSLPPFGSVQGSMGPVFSNEQLQQLPVDTTSRMSHEQRLQGCYDLARHLGLFRDRNTSKDLSHLKPKGEVHNVPKVPSKAVVMDVFPGRR